MMVRMHVSWALKLPFFALVPDSGAHGDHDAAQVEVEPVGNVVQGAALDLLSHGELVGVTTGIEGDTSDEEVGADHRGGKNHKLVTLFESDDNTEKGDADNDGPEDGGFLSQLEGVAQSKSKKSTGSTTEKCEAIF